ncbi:hypothetical protein [Rossellomorea sp. RS05]|uniref:hypothetical protein n=1 Tax=Rossellomorea sp. RS05 TaxID=3149166 RepID=UPI003221EC3D
MLKSKWFIIQEGSLLPKELYKLFKEEFQIGDIGLKPGNTYISKFVGFILKEDKCLISFPKHYFSPRVLQELQPVKESDKVFLNKDLKLLFNVIKKSANQRSIQSIGMEGEINYNYPFQSFFEVYNYYLKYGLYTNERDIKVSGYSGNINWKQTILKSPMILTSNNLIYMPMVIKKKLNEHAFISKCMAYIIDSTAEFLSVFIDIKRTNLDFKEINWNNNKLIIRHLREIKQSIFKDIHVKLINSLIKFFQKENTGKNLILIKTQNFELIWEAMVGSYLQNYFKRINEHGYIEFSGDKNPVQKPFNKRVFYPDIAGKKGRRFEPDYYLLEGNVRYIFDGKYFNEIKELNYKQISYYFLLKHYEKNFNGIDIVNTYNILLLPTYKENSDQGNYVNHFQLNPLFNDNEKDFSIKEQYCNVKIIMSSYIN